MANKFESCKNCTENKSRSKDCKECDGQSHFHELYDADPECRHNIKCASGGGIKCTKCGGWFCF